MDERTDGQTDVRNDRQTERQSQTDRWIWVTVSGSTTPKHLGIKLLALCSRLYFPSEGRHAEDFFARKNPTASAGFEPTNLGTRG
jgi:hypothetical protein